MMTSLPLRSFYFHFIPSYLNSDGSFVYTPFENFNGEDQFEYRVCDGVLYGNNNAIVTINVNPVNDVPQWTVGGNIETFEDAGEQNILNFITNIDDGDPEDIKHSHLI